jgi:hypothetical protein
MADGSVIEPTGPCEWCLTFEGRTKKGRPCCELRALAGMPKAQREAVYMKVWKEDGADAYEKLKRDVVAEYKRRVAFMQAKRGSFVAAAKAALVRPSI